MAAPSFVNPGTGATDAGGAWAYTCQASAAAGRVFIVQILQDGTTNGAVTITGASNIENLAGTDNAWTQIPGANADGSHPIGSAVVARQFLYIGRALSTSAPTISGGNSTSEDLYIRSYQYTDVNTGTTLADVIENSTAGTAVNAAGTSEAIPDTGVTTLGTDRLALNFDAINDDNSATQYVGASGGIWNLEPGYAESTGTDGSIAMQFAIMASAGTIDGGSFNQADATDGWGVVGFALIGTTPSVAVPRNPAVNFQDPGVL